MPANTYGAKMMKTKKKKKGQRGGSKGKGSKRG